MARLPEFSAAPISGHQEISALADVWTAMAVQGVLEPDLDEILGIQLGRLCRQIQGEQQYPSANSSRGPIGEAANLKSPAASTPPLYLGGGYFSRFSISKLSKIWPL
jgi:hypothetical protein